MSGGQNPSPGLQLAVSPCAAEHNAPPPVASAVTVYVLFVQSTSHSDHEPEQSRIGSHPVNEKLLPLHTTDGAVSASIRPWPAEHPIVPSSATIPASANSSPPEYMITSVPDPGEQWATQAPSPTAQTAVSPWAAEQALPWPLAISCTVYTFAQSTSHSDHEPTQSKSTGQSSSPSSHGVAAGHSAPPPLCAVVSVQTRLHSVVHADQLPTQSTFAGHSSSPGAQATASAQAAPSPERD